MSLAYIETIRDHIDRAFLAADYDHQRFGAIAEAALRQAEVSTRFQLDFDELTRWMLVPDHVFPTAGRRQFSDLPITIARGNGFYIEALVWAIGTASIHQHSFSGAFAVVKGSSIHSHYRLQTRQRVSEGLRLVDCELEQVELLRAGDVRRIESGSGLTHAVFHLEEPTISLVVRTNHEPWAAPQLLVLPPHYAVAPEWLKRDGQMEALERAFRTMARLSEPRFAEIVGARLAALDLPRAILLLTECLDILIGPHLEPIVARVMAAHGEAARHLPAVVQRSRHSARIKALRHITHDERERFALAALMVAQTQEQARRILAMHPDGEALVTGSSLPVMPKLWAELAA